MLAGPCVACVNVFGFRVLVRLFLHRIKKIVKKDISAARAHLKNSKVIKIWFLSKLSF